MNLHRRLAVPLLAIAVLMAAGACQVPGLPKSADAIYGDARAAVGSSISYRLSVVLTLTGSRQRYNLTVARSGSSSGTLEINGTAVDVIQTAGKTYLKGKAFIATFGSADVAAQIGDRWVRTNSNPLGALDSLGPDRLAQTIKGKNSLQNGGDQTIDGAAVTKLYDKDGAIYVARTGKPYILKVETAKQARPGGLSDLVADYSDYDKAKPDPAPASFIDVTH